MKPFIVGVALVLVMLPALIYQSDIHRYTRTAQLLDYFVLEEMATIDSRLNRNQVQQQMPQIEAYLLMGIDIDMKLNPKLCKDISISDIQVATCSDSSKSVMTVTVTFATPDFYRLPYIKKTEYVTTI
ncbi:MAG: hypothetical protein LBN22_03235 [Clostridiales Family XIII bacterium]|jgi:hypothetical protein|nr:hypothetical protein [Clostridiales Family XIII bacterium]